jgi:hypothetical protein
MKKQSQNKNKKVNLDSEHRRTLSSFGESVKRKTTLNAQRVRLKIELSEETDSYCRGDLERKIKEVDAEINSIDKTKQEYYMKTGKMLYDYYVDNNKTVSTPVVTAAPGSLNTILSTSSSSNKPAIADKYIVALYPEHEIDINSINMSEMTCDCGGELTLNRSDGELLCQKCGGSYDDIIDSDTRVYKNIPPDVTYFAYKRLNHLKELLAQFQGKGNANISADDYVLIRAEIKKKNLDVNLLTPKQMRAILKKLGRPKLYDHAPQIIHKINGKQSLTLTRAQTRQIISMFTQMQEPYNQCKTTGRQNFLNYSYMLYKVFEMIGLKHFLHCFKMMKEEKVYKHDKVWKCMCAKLDWPFIRTI